MRRFASFLPMVLCTAVLLVSTRAAAQSTPVATLLASADEAWIAGRYDDAFVRYSQVLQQDSSSARALFRTATLLAWRNDLDRSISLFRLYVRQAPRDDDGRIGLARSLAWRGRYTESLSLCDSIVAENPKQRDAALLAAQALAWSGHVEDAIGRYQRWLASHDDDAAAWVALAQSWRWAGRPEETRRAVEHALLIDPHNDAARTQLDWANAALAPSLEPTVINTNDSDDNRSTLYLLQGGLASPWGARVLGDALYRVADLNALHGTATSLRASSSWSPLDGRWTLRGEIGAARLDGSNGAGGLSITHVQPILAARVSGRPLSTLSLGLGASHSAFDETAALILAGIGATGVGADADLTLRPRLTLGGGGEWTRLTGGSGPNTRGAGSGVLRWSATRFLSVAAGVRGFTYQHAAFDGYFAPRRYVLGEMSSRIRVGGELGWGAETEFGIGDQSITAFDNSTAARFAQRLSIAAAYRPAAGLEWGISGGFANVASPTTISSADYRSYTIALKARWRL
jgi:tetratricopeptide (TPR) repeat protein